MVDPIVLRNFRSILSRKMVDNPSKCISVYMLLVGHCLANVDGLDKILFAVFYK